LTGGFRFIGYFHYVRSKAAATTARTDASYCTAGVIRLSINRSRA
jgi:hypothetical protein